MRSEPISALYQAARDDIDYLVLDELTVRAGLVWVCRTPTAERPDGCDYRNDADAETCGECGTEVAA